MIVSVMDHMMALLGANVGYALVGAFLWGVASVLLSPCHLTSIPLIMGFIAQGSDGRQKKAFLLSLEFTLGIFLAMGILGAITAALGRIFGDIGAFGNWLGAGIFLILGLLLLDILSIPQPSVNHDRFKGGGAKAALILGFLFGTVLGPCAFAFMMPVLGMALSKGNSEPVFATILVLSYAMGHAAVILLAGSASAWTMNIVQSPRNAFWLRLARKALGVVSISIAIWFGWSIASV